MNVQTIIENYLKENGFDGLVHSGRECGCQLVDFAACGDAMLDCEAAHIHVADPQTGFDYMMYPGKCGKDCGFMRAKGFQEELGEDDLVGLPKEGLR